MNESNAMLSCISVPFTALELKDVSNIVVAACAEFYGGLNGAALGVVPDDKNYWSTSVMSSNAETSAA